MARNRTKLIRTRHKTSTLPPLSFTSSCTLCQVSNQTLSSGGSWLILPFEPSKCSSASPNFRQHERPKGSQVEAKRHELSGLCLFISASCSREARASSPPIVCVTRRARPAQRTSRARRGRRHVAKPTQKPFNAVRATSSDDTSAQETHCNAKRVEYWSLVYITVYY